jgi:DNA-binding NtrC family response regulator
MVERGTFREDLYYRLDVLSIHVPPLRERREDVPLLAEVFLERATRANRRTLEGFTPDALVTLAAHDFPGNVRELQNLVERFAILAAGPRVTSADVRRALDRSRGRTITHEVQGVALAELVERFERHVIEAAIAEHGNRAAAARALEVERSFFYKKCKRFGIVGDT